MTKPGSPGKGPGGTIEILSVATDAGTVPGRSVFVEGVSGADRRGEVHRSGCMVCGADLVYVETDRDDTCHYCGRVVRANTRCEEGHFVCDGCHRADAVEIVRQVCLHTTERDAVALMQVIRSHPRFPIHGPEHHSLVPAVIMTALRNGDDRVANGQIITAIERGKTITGGACAFLGACGAAVGVGVAVSLLLAATPYDGDKRRVAQRATLRALGKIASFDAPRCCQRDSWLALREASALLEEWLGRSLAVSYPIRCAQFLDNKECIRDRCPLWPA